MNIEVYRLYGVLTKFREKLSVAINSLNAVREEEQLRNIDSIRLRRLDNAGQIKVEYIKVVKAENTSVFDYEHQMAHVPSDEPIRHAELLTDEYKQILLNIPLMTFMDPDGRSPYWYNIQNLTNGLNDFRLERVTFHNSEHTQNFDLFLMMDKQYLIRFTLQFRPSSEGVACETIFEIRKLN